MEDGSKLNVKYEIVPDRQIRIRNVPTKTIEELKNASKHVGISMGTLLKGKLIDWLAELPEHYKKPMED